MQRDRRHERRPRLSAASLSRGQRGHHARRQGAGGAARAQAGAQSLHAAGRRGGNRRDAASRRSMREVREETQLAIEPVALAGHREVIVRDAQGRVERHFVILCFAARWLAGEPVLNEELDDARWLEPVRAGAAQDHRGPGRDRRRGGRASSPRRVNRGCLANASERGHIAPNRARVKKLLTIASLLLCLAAVPARADDTAAAAHRRRRRSTTTCSGWPKSSARCTICARSAAPMRGRNGATRCSR